MYKNSKKAFSLVEVLVAIFILNLGILGVTTLLVSTIKKYRISSDEFVAASLAQEGIEYVRYKRDSNWLNNKTVWNGIESGTNETITFTLNNKSFARNVQVAGCPDADDDSCKLITSSVSLDNNELIKVQSRLYDWKQTQQNGL